jgi:hypothetical protein
MLEAGTEVPTSNKMCQTTQECMHLEKHLEGNILLLCAKQVGIPGVNSAVLKVNEGF